MVSTISCCIVTKLNLLFNSFVNYSSATYKTYNAATPPMSRSSENLSPTHKHPAFSTYSPVGSKINAADPRSSEVKGQQDGSSSSPLIPGWHISMPFSVNHSCPACGFGFVNRSFSGWGFAKFTYNIFTLILCSLFPFNHLGPYFSWVLIVFHKIVQWLLLKIPRGFSGASKIGVGNLPCKLLATPFCVGSSL